MHGPFSRSCDGDTQRPHDLALAGPGTRAHRYQDVAPGCGTRHRTGVVAQAVAGVERYGPLVEGVEEADCGESPSGQHRRVSPRGSRVGAPTPPARGSAQSWYPLPHVLAARSMTKLLATHIDTLVLPAVHAEAMSVFLAEVSRRHPGELIL